MTAKLILFACTHNAGRSQIASAFFNAFADPAKAHSIAAGLEAMHRVHGEVVTAMREVGIDLSMVRPVELTGRMLTDLDFLVTLGCPERCPAIPNSRRQPPGGCATRTANPSVRSERSATRSERWLSSWSARNAGGSSPHRGA